MRKLLSAEPLREKASTKVNSDKAKPPLEGPPRGADSDAEFVDSFFEKLIASFGSESPSTAPHPAADLQRLFADAPPAPGVRSEPPIKRLLQAKLESPPEAPSLEKEIQSLEENAEEMDQAPQGAALAILALLYRAGGALLKEPASVLRVVKVLAKACLRGGGELAGLRREQNKMLMHARALEKEVRAARLESETKKFANSFMAVRSFTLGMAEIMDKEALRLRGKLRCFQKRFQSRVSKLENQFRFEAPQSARKTVFRRVRPGQKGYKRSHEEFQEGALSSLFQRKALPSAKAASPRLASPCPNLPFWDGRNGSIPNTIFPGQKPMVSMPEIKTPFSIKFGSRHDALNLTDLVRRGSPAGFAQDSPLAVELREETPGQRRRAGRQRNAGCFVVKDRKQWSTKKAVFCWDNNGNLAIVAAELVLHLANLFGNIISPQELVVQEVRIKAFTKSATQPNLLAVKLEVSERYRGLIEESWKEGSPSDYFKFKIDLLRRNAIRFWNDVTQSNSDLPVKNLHKSPARYNYSQANHFYKSEILNKVQLNMRIFQRLKKK